MADNYLEKRYEEVFGNGGSGRGGGNSGFSGGRGGRGKNPSLDSLLLRNRSHRAFLKEHVVRADELETIVGVNTKLPSARNQQVLRFKIVLPGTPESASVLNCIHLGGALPELHLPATGTEPEAFIVVCSLVPENRLVDVDLGIALQSMGLKAVELGLNSTIVFSIDKKRIQEVLDLPSEPLAVLCIGKGQDKIQLLSIDESAEHNYYRKEGIHYVPKVALKDLIIK